MLRRIAAQRAAIRLEAWTPSNGATIFVCPSFETPPAAPFMFGLERDGGVK